MSLVQEHAPDTFRIWTGQKLVRNNVTVSAPLTVEALWSDEELAEWGLFRPVPFVAPAGKVAVGIPRFERQGGVVVEVRDVQDEPPPTAAQIRRDTFAGDVNVRDLLDKLDNASLEQIDTWLTNNVTNLAQARTVLGYILKALVLFRRD